MPAPAVLECQFSFEPVRADPVILAALLRDGQLELTGDKAIADAGAICAHLPADRRWVCRVRAEPGSTSVVFDYPRSETRTGPPDAGRPKRPEIAVPKSVSATLPPSMAPPTRPYVPSLRTVVLVLIAIALVVLVVSLTLQRSDEGKGTLAPVAETAPNTSTVQPSADQPQGSNRSISMPQPVPHVLRGGTASSTTDKPHRPKSATLQGQPVTPQGARGNDHRLDHPGSPAIRGCLWAAMAAAAAGGVTLLFLLCSRFRKHDCIE